MSSNVPENLESDTAQLCLLWRQKPSTILAVSDDERGKPLPWANIGIRR
jgi:hypothetical protein